ncbi:MAG: type II secretion system F family protein [Verrucomicrobiota bacterium JB024]|nr:type II secretion system F family protein [Verrucomicrobiota bacterium JB024]
MPTFSYRGIDASGKTSTGSLEATDRRQVIQKLRAKKIQPLEIRQKKGGASRAAAALDDAPAPSAKASRPGLTARLKRKVSPALVLPFFSKLHQLHNSGMSIGDAVNLMTQRMSDEGLKELSVRIYKDLSEGRTLAVSMRSQPEIFDPMMAHLVEAGEATGNVVPILDNLIAHLERKAELKGKMISALVYPVFLIFVALGVVALFLFFLLPRIQTMLDSLGEKLNLAARVLIGFSEFLLKDGPFIFGALALGFVFIMQWRKSDKGRYATDRWLLKIPLIKSLVYNSEICRVTNVLGILLGNGVNTTESLRLAENTVGNRVMLERYRGARAMINDGAPFSVAFKKYQLLPDLDLDIISIGENTGSLVSGFHEVFKMHSEELESKIKLSTSLVAGTALTSAFVMVAVLTLGIIMSILNVSQNLMNQ